MRGQPAFGSVAFAILLLSSILRGDELRHQRQRSVVAGSYDRGCQHLVAILHLAVAALARRTLWTAQLLRTEILCPVERNQRPARKALKNLQAVAMPQLGQHLIEAGLQLLWRNIVQQDADMVVGGNLRDPKQGTAVRCAVALLQMPLAGQKRLTLHEKQGKRSKPDVGPSSSFRPPRAAVDLEIHRTPRATPPKATPKSPYLKKSRPLTQKNT